MQTKIRHQILCQPGRHSDRDLDKAPTSAQPSNSVADCSPQLGVQIPGRPKCILPGQTTLRRSENSALPTSGEQGEKAGDRRQASDCEGGGITCQGEHWICTQNPEGRPPNEEDHRAIRPENPE